MELGDWLRGALKRGRLGQAELARKLTAELGRSIDRAAVNKMATGARGIAADEMLAIARITGKSLPGGTVTRVPLLSSLSELANAEYAPLLDVAGLESGKFIALRVTDDAMDRVSPPGSIIIVNRADRRLEQSRSYLFQIKGEALYRRWHADPAYLDPFSTNPKHQPIFIRQRKDLDVIGRVYRTVLDL